MLSETTLTALHAAISEGTATEIMFYTWRPDLTGSRHESEQMFKAYEGDFVAALSFAATALPNWDWMSAVDAYRERYFVLECETDGFETEEAYGENPGRGLLLASVKALLYEAANG